MNLLERYELILRQGIGELGPPEMPADREKAFELQGLLAPQLGDVLYRLTIEHGVAFAPCRETIIGLIADHRPIEMEREGEHGQRRFATDLEELHPLILLALEMMPAEAPDI